jgi:hypothetical protein
MKISRMAGSEVGTRQRGIFGVKQIVREEVWQEGMHWASKEQERKETGRPKTILAE